MSTPAKDTHKTRRELEPSSLPLCWAISRSPHARITLSAEKKAHYARGGDLKGRNLPAEMRDLGRSARGQRTPPAVKPVMLNHRHDVGYGHAR